MVEHDAYLVAGAQGGYVFADPTDTRGVVTRLRCGERVYSTGKAEGDWLEVFGGALAAGGDAERGDRGWVRGDEVVTCDAKDPNRAVQDGGSDANVDWRRVSALTSLGFDEMTRKRRPATMSLPCGAWVRGADFVSEDDTEGKSDPLETSAWWRIATPDGQTAWVQSADVTTHEAGVMEELRGFVGRPYVWGGSDGFGMDCSGVVLFAARWLVEHEAGVTRYDTDIHGHAYWLPHSARRQFSETWPALATVGEDRSIDEVSGDIAQPTTRDKQGSAARDRWANVVRPGDIAYFAMGGRRVDHVGFVETLDQATGAATLLHASSAGDGGTPPGPCVRREALWPKPGESMANKLAARMVGLRRFKPVLEATAEATP
ncbi:MAG: NlpC/P60 family protein [Planctomycetota bacterium]